MKSFTISGALLALFILAVPAFGQHHMSNWVHRTATDTTIVQCRTDSLTGVAFPPNSMNMMMMPDSIYCTIDRMDMDSLRFPHDSTFIGWFGVQVGRDSMNSDMMNGDSVYGSHNMMQFMTNVSCYFYWDSLIADSMHGQWHPTEMMGWNGSGWVSLGGTMVGNTITLASSQVYSGFAFIGSPSSVVSVADRQMTPGEFRLDQNYPNPFNPSTDIEFYIVSAGHARLAAYDLLGREVSVLVDGSLDAGPHTARFDATGFASGVYLYRLTTQGGTATRTMLLMR